MFEITFRFRCKNASIKYGRYICDDAIGAMIKENLGKVSFSKLTYNKDGRADINLQSYIDMAASTAQDEAGISRVSCLTEIESVEDLSKKG